MEFGIWKNEKELRKEGKEAAGSRVSRDGDMTVVRWLDNGIVNVASSYMSVDEQDTVNRWSQKQLPEVVY